MKDYNEEDAILEAGLKGVGLFLIIAALAIVSLYLVNCTGLFS